ncbi:uncharacterized protein [Watersipora subatra]|uniref:uncharacterized protein n=1 Tax=Watersipora subatra TaxID=2589382 RepID=UPI00355C2F7E
MASETIQNDCAPIWGNILSGSGNFRIETISSRQGSFRKAAKFLCEDFYVDDGITSVSTAEGPIQLLKDTSEICSHGKYIQQRVTAAELDWDAPIPTEEKLEWERWLEDLKTIDKISIKRCMKKAGMDVQTTQIHVFNDASLKGYGACCYLRQVGKDGTVHTMLLFGKSRVAPLKPVTIPRLELQAAVIAVRISKLVSRELKLSFEEMYFWCDSQIVLGYIANESKRFHMYVANRIHEIHQNSTPSQWHYVKSKDNPADMASRGASVDELINSSWLSGPDFLKEHDVKAYKEANDVIRKVEEHDPEVKPVKVLKTSAAAPNIAHKFLKYSTFNELVKSLAILQKSVRKKTWKSVSATAEDMQEAEVLAIKRTQEMSFQEEIQTLKENKSVTKDSTIAKLNPYLDKQSILRVGGRLHRADITTNEKCPMIVPKYSHLAKLLVRHHHHRIHHLGRRSPLAATREAGYWIIRGASTVKSTISDCFACSKLRKPLQEQLMGDLSAERVQRTPPFSRVGMNVFGPYHVRERRSTLKRYGLIFTCLYSRAVHIEMLDDPSTDSFINALGCLTAIKGHVIALYSDNATNFVGAKNLFDKELERVSDPKMQKYLLDHRITFKNNTPEASHQGGAWEKLIRSAKAVLNGMAINYKERIDSQTLRTAFYEVASTLNNKPPTATNIRSLDEEIIAPNRLLTMKRGQTSALPPGKFTDSEVYGKARWKKAQQIADEFFKPGNLNI